MHAKIECQCFSPETEYQSIVSSELYWVRLTDVDGQLLEYQRPDGDHTPTDNVVPLFATYRASRTHTELIQRGGLLA